MCKISVLMSTYNESEKELNESINSILNQTFKDFEFIIVNDNPKNADLKIILKKWAGIDKRIKIIENQENIGLAMSLNKAAEVAKGKYLARMDADDISITNRFDKQLFTIEKNINIDMVCSDILYIDEDSKIIENKSINFNKSQNLNKIIAVWNVIHHPTVLLPKNIFCLLGGYRDFPCSQDYDLWLRLITYNYKIFIINEPLLKYRIRSNNISSAKRFLQVITAEYIKLLYKERIKKGTDSYSKDNYRKYLENRKYFNNSYKIELEEKRKLLKLSRENFRNKKYINACMQLIYLLSTSSYFRDRIKIIILIKLTVKYAMLKEKLLG